MKVLHVANLSVQTRPGDQALLARADHVAHRDGWTVAAAHDTALDLTLFIIAPDQTVTAMTTRTVRTLDLPTACTALPVHHLDHAFDPAADHHDHAWDALRRLHPMIASLPTLGPLTEHNQRSILSWACMAPDTARPWQDAGVTSGVDARFYMDHHLTPDQVGPFARSGWFYARRWTRGTVAAFVRHHLTVGEAIAWSRLGFSLDTLARFLAAGYTSEQALALLAAHHEVGVVLHHGGRDLYAGRAEDAVGHRRVPLTDWVHARISPSLAPLAVRAGLTPGEAADSDLDEHALATLAALRDAAPVWSA